MRIACVCLDLGVPIFGTKGCSVHVQEIIRGLVRRGAQVDLFAARAGGDMPADFPPIGMQWLFTSPAGGAAEREQAALAANAALEQALASSGPFDFVYERYSLWSYAGMEYARAAGIPGMLEVNAPLIEEQIRARTLVNRAGARHVADRVFAAAHALLPVSKEVAAYLEEFPAARGRIHVVANGVDAERVRPGLAPSRPKPAGSFTIGFVGTLKPWHGLGTLVAAFEHVHRSAPQSRLLIVGTGTEEERLIHDLEQRNLRDVAHLTGGVPPGGVPALLASMDVAVAPAPAVPDFYYFSPLKLFEYMAAGLPVVAANIGQIGEVIQHDQTGLLCPAGDAAALAAALERLRCDSALRERLGAAARARVVQSHTWDRTIERILDLARGATATDSTVAMGA